MTPEEIASFVEGLSSAMTIWKQGSEMMLTRATVFEARGGTPVFGDDALAMIFLSNDFEIWLTPERRETIARLRNDM
jgi:hypothetical protein